MSNTFIQTCDTRSELYRFCLFITSITVQGRKPQGMGFPFYGMQSEVHRALVVESAFLPSSRTHTPAREHSVCCCSYWQMQRPQTTK